MWFCTDFVVHEFSTINKYTTGRLPVFLFLLVRICMHSILFVFAFASICAMDIRWRQGGGENREREQQCAPNSLPAITHICFTRGFFYKLPCIIFQSFKVLKLLRVPLIHCNVSQFSKICVLHCN